MRRWIAAAALLAALGTAGCGAATHRTGLQRAIAVIRGWSLALRRGDVAAAAGYFALPSLLVNGVEFRIRTRADARAANAGLSCGARLVSATQDGRFVSALFVLTGRPGPGGSDCGPGAGQVARTDFIIHDGKILAWIRAADLPPSGPPPGPQTGNAPSETV